MVGIMYAISSESAFAAAAAGAPSTGLLLAFAALALGSALSAGFGTLRLIEGMRAADLSTLWEANKMFLAAALCAAAFVFILRLSGLNLLALIGMN